MIGSLTLAAALATAAPTACNTTAILGAMRSSIGSMQPRARELVGTGSATISGLKGTGSIAIDLADGKNALRTDVAVMGSTDQVYDGSVTWVRDGSGGVHAWNSDYSRAQAVTDAYLARRGYLEPGAEANVTCQGTKRVNGRDVIVLRVQPPHGSAATLDVDSRTHLIAAIEEAQPISTQITSFDDYRRVNGTMLPFRIAIGTDFEPLDQTIFAIDKYAARGTVRAADFARPAPTDVVRMSGGARSTSVPMLFEAKELIVEASIDGRPPMPFILDTGGHAILTREAAKTLGLSTKGQGESSGAGSSTTPLAFTRTRTLRIGDATLRDVPFLVIDYPYSFGERGRKTPLGGILGLEIFERFAVKLDYAKRLVTLTPFANFTQRPAGVAVPISFQADVPLASAAADDKNGLFMLDTGNSGSFILFTKFLERSGLGAKYPHGDALQGHGTGGANTGYRVNLPKLEFAGVTLSDVFTYCAQMTTGSFASSLEAGNIGNEILSRFTPTFDYSRDALYMDFHANVPPPVPNRSGMSFFKDAPDAFTVTLVPNGSPAAAAGLKSGDRIVSVDGVAATELSRADLYDRVREPVGTNIKLGVARDGKTEDLTLVLR